MVVAGKCSRSIVKPRRHGVTKDGKSECGARKTVSRRNMLALAGSAGVFTIMAPRARLLAPAAERFFDRASYEQVADNDPAARPPLLVDAQTHVW
jgi:hypothetical protein